MILAERKIGDLTVELECELELEACIVNVTDAKGSFQLYPTTGREAVQMFHHPYPYAAWSGIRKVIDLTGVIDCD